MKVPVSLIIEAMRASNSKEAWEIRQEISERIKAYGIAPPEGYVLVPVDTFNWWSKLTSIILANPERFATTPDELRLLASAPKPEDT